MFTFFFWNQVQSGHLYLTLSVVLSKWADGDKQASESSICI